MQRLTYKATLTPICLAIWATLQATGATAQTAPAAPTAADKAQEIVVSGSRIKRDNFNTPAPLLIIRGSDTAQAGFSTTAEVLQGTEVTGGQAQINNAYGGFVVEGGPGVNTVGLRGFAPTRSLVLLNGRRLSPSGTRGSVGAADLNVLPNALVDRIEVLKDGSSSIYGSDAITGVINIITRRNLTGITAETRLSAPEDGGAENMTFALSAGLVRDRGFLSGSYEYTERKGLTLGDRDWTQCNTDLRRTSVAGVVGEWGSGDFIDPRTGKPKCYPITFTGSNGVTINTIGILSPTGGSITGVGAPGSVGTAFNRWRPNSNVTTGVVGYEGVGGGANNLNVRDTLDPRKFNEHILSPVKLHNLFVQGGLEMGPVELYTEIMYSLRQSSQVGYRQLSLDYMRGSPQIPASLAAITGNFLPAQAHTNGTPVGVRAFIGFGNSFQSQDVNFLRSVFGARGTVGATGWDFDVTLTSGRSKADYTFESFLIDRMARSLDAVVTSSGGLACRNPADGCVAAPALTAAVVGGALPKSWVDYVYRPLTGTTKYNEDVLTAVVTGPMFKMPGGSAKAALGVESRRFSLDDSPPPDSQNGNLLGLTSSVATNGKDSANDAFVELEFPLLANQPLAQTLTFNVSGRWADYKSYGAGSTYKAGGIWSPAKWLTFRATTGTSYRAPTIFEQNLGATTGFINQTNDPCNDWDNPSRAGTPRAINCAAEGVPAGFTQNQSITVVSKGGRDSGLQAETSLNNTYGIIVQPALPTGWGDLSLALDRFDIKVDNGVSRVGGAAILRLCYDSVGFRGAGSFCRLINPRSMSNALTVNDSYINLATDVVRGLDLTARYSNDIGPGRLRVNANFTSYDFQASKLFATDPLDNVNGTVTNPRASGTVDISDKLRGWTAYYGATWLKGQSSYAYFNQNPDTSTELLRVPGYITHAASLTYEADTWSATLGVRNLTNEEPPVISAGRYNRIGNAPLYSGYDYIGRRVFLNASKKF